MRKIKVYFAIYILLFIISIIAFGIIELFFYGFFGFLSFPMTEGAVYSKSEIIEGFLVELLYGLFFFIPELLLFISYFRIRKLLKCNVDKADLKTLNRIHLSTTVIVIISSIIFVLFFVLMRFNVSMLM